MTTIIRGAVLPVLLALMVSPLLHAATDAERINQLEQQLMQQRQLLDAMAAELEALKAAASDAGVALEDTVVVTGVQDAEGAIQAPLESTARTDPGKLSLQLYGFAMADAIYEQARPNYHSVATGTMDELLGRSAN